MAPVTLLEKARHGRLAALASLDSRQNRDATVVSLFDNVFETAPETRATVPSGSNVIAFRSTRRAAEPRAAEAAPAPVDNVVPLRRAA